MKDFRNRHTFAICAYGDSPYLTECLDSLLRQTVKSTILLATSTPSPFLREVDEKNGIEYHVNPLRGGGISADWNFALSCCRTQWCTIAHQDDVYLPAYAENVTARLEQRPETGIVFTDYADLLPGGRQAYRRGYLIVKRLLLWPFYLRNHHASGFIKRWILRFGCPICCPSVTYNLSLPEKPEFDSAFSVNPDWAMWLTLAGRQEEFAYCPKRLMLHRLSGGMETAAAIRDNRRAREDALLFNRLWPAPIARILAQVYALSYRSNRSV